jgi:deoxyribonuclease-4
MKEFLDFVESFGSPKLRVCVDTCHVFAAGHDPKAYLEAAINRPGLLKLVHYNDSLGDCGSCVDRHAHIASGEGLIGFPKMSEIAQLCSTHNIPMVIE